MARLHNPAPVRPSRASAEWDRRLRGRRPGRAPDRMIDPSQIARVLASAARDRGALPPFTDEHPELDEATAYDAQWAGIDARLDAGERLVGAKLGLTSRVKQQAMKGDTPLYGWVTSGMLLPYGEPVELTRFI